jgi:acetyl-CoA carboxylase carboxyl transferase subunit alpha
MRTYLDFEKPIADIDARIERLGDAEDASKLKARRDRVLRQVYRRLGAWQTVQVARHPERPSAVDVLRGLTEPFVPLAGDPLLGDDAGLLGGLGRIGGYSVVTLATDRRVHDGGPGAAGFRKVERLIRLADRLVLPLVAFVDVPALAPADAARALALAGCIEAALALRAPLVSVVVGEAVGDEGYALTIADRTLMLEYAVAYAVTPERAAETLWQDPTQVKAAAEALKPTARELADLGLIDGVVPEPPGAAHRDPGAAIAAVGDAVVGAIAQLIDTPGRDLWRQRRDRIQSIATAERAGAAGA